MVNVLSIRVLFLLILTEVCTVFTRISAAEKVGPDKELL